MNSSDDEELDKSSSSCIIENFHDNQMKFIKEIDYEVSSEDEDLNTIVTRNQIYVKEKLSIDEIEKQMKVNKSQVRYWFKQWEN